MKSIPYVKFEAEEAIAAQRGILSSQAEVLKTLKVIQIYREIRKRELARKNKLRISIARLNNNIRQFLSQMPEVEKLPDLKREAVKETKTKKTIDLELKEIQRKLAELG